MKKIISSVLMCVLSFNTIATPLIGSDVLLDKREQSNPSRYITLDNNSNSEVLVDKSSLEKSPVIAQVQENKTFKNTNEVKIAPIDLNEKRNAAVSNDPQNDKSHLDRFHEQRNTEVDRHIDPSQFGLGKAGSYASQEAEKKLNNFGGTSRVTLTGGDGFQTGSVDVLIPVNKYYDADKHLFFVQMGARKSNYLSQSYRTTLNLGAGYRYFTDNNWMYGVNSFYDHDITRGHSRLGLGAEAWTNNFKLSANTYHRLSDWKDSPDLLNYQERPANGFDVRAEGALPNLPQVTGKVMYEKYFGDEVGLFGESTRQKDPSALTFGVAYKPVPMLSIGLDHRMGQNSKKDTRVNIALNYEIGTPLKEQLDPKRVNQRNTLQLNKTALVERNNEIVLEYKLKPTGTIKLPENLSGNPLATITFPITVETNVSLNSFTWSGTAAPFTQPYNGSIGVVTLPVYSTAILNNYTLQLNAIDPKGRTISSNVLNITVDGLTVTVLRSKAVANADGTDSITFTATLTDKNGIGVSGQPFQWNVRNASILSQETTTDANGQARVIITSTSSAIAEVDAIDPQTGVTVTENAQFAGVAANAVVSNISAPTNTLVTNGSTVTLSALVVDNNGNTVAAGVPVTWATTGGTLSATTSLTNSSGIATINLTSSTTAGNFIVSARGITTDTGRVFGITFTADNTTGKVSAFSANPNSLAANGISSSTISTTVLDANGNPVGAGVVVNWTTSSGTLSGATSVTNASGIATINLTSGLVAGTANVTGRTNNDDAGSSISVSFVADNSTAKVRSISSNNTSITANGSSVSTISAIIEDANGNLVGAGVTVNWTSSLGSLSGATSVTNASGVATIVLTSGTVVGVSTVTARGNLSDSGQTTNVTFVSDTATAKVDALTSSTLVLVANGTSTATLSATVTDGNNNPLGAGVTVNWSANSGTLSGATSVTNASGVATIVLTSTTSAGTILANARGTTGDSGQNVSINLVADNSTAKVDSLNATSNSIIANGLTTTTLSAVVSDVNGNIVGAGVAVLWETTGGALANTTTTTNASGVASVVLTSSTTAGAVTVTAKGGSSDTGRTTNINFISNPATAQVGAISASVNSAIAGSTNPITVNATMVDGNGNALGSGVTVNWSAIGGTVGSATSITNSSGIASITYTPGLVSGNSTVTARGVSGDTGMAVTIVLEGNTATARVSNIVSTDTSIVANGSTTTLSATVVDSNGNPLGSGITVNWTAANGTLPSATSITNSSGVASITFTSGNTAGTASVTARGATGDIGISQNITLIANTASAKVSNLSVANNSLVANGSTTTATATLTDANDNLLGAGVTVTWTATNGTVIGTSTTNASGQATTTFTSSNSAGVATITARGATGDLGQSVPITLIGDTASAKVSNLNIADNSLIANGTSTTTATATITDANNNPLGAGVTVNWTSTGGTLSGATSVTNSSGVATITFTSGVLAGTANIAARGATSDTGMNGNITLISDATSAKVDSVTSVESAITANSSSTTIISANVTDANNNPLGAGVTVTWATTRGTLSNATSVTNTSGVATVTLTSSNVAGIVTVSARGAGSDTGKTVDVEFVANSATAKVNSITSAQSNIVADGVSSTTITAIVVDANDNPLGAGVTVNWSSTGGSISSATSVTNASGIATITFTSGVNSGTASVIARGATGDTGRTANITLSGNTLTAKVSNIVTQDNVLVSGGLTSTTVTATVVDANDNPLSSGVIVNWNATNGSVSSATSVTNASGVATITYTSGNTAGASSITARGVAGDIGQTATVTLTANTATARVSQINGSASSIVANGVSTSLISATVVDGNNNPLGEGVTVTWAATNGTIVATSTTNSSGVATATFTSGTVAGTANVTARGVEGDAGQIFNITLTANAATARVSNLTRTPASIIADGSSNSVFSATVVDGNNNALGSGVTVNWTATNGTIAATSTTNASGVATATFTSGTVAGTANITARGVSGDVGQSATVTLTANAATARVSNLSRTPASIVANGISTSVFSATVVDANGNIVGSGVTVNWTTTSGTIAATSTTNASGIATATLTSSTTAGTATVSARGIVSDTGLTSTVTFTANEATARVSNLSRTPTSIVANGVSTSVFTATVVDENGNALGSGVTVNWTTTNGTIAATSVTNALGQATATLTSSTTAGVSTVTARGVSGDIGQSATVTLTANAATARVSNLTGTPTSIVANGSSTSTFTATVVDANNNALGSGVTVNWTTTSGTIVATSTTNASGQATATLTSSTTAGAVTVNAKGIASDVGVSSTITFTANASTARVNNLTRTPTSIVANGSSTSTFTATVVDANNNALGSGVAVNWTAINGTIVATSTTNASGQASATFTSGLVAGTANVTARGVSGDVGQSATVTLTANTATARVTSLTNNNASIVANAVATSTLSATVRDANNNIVGAGVTVNWATTSGTLSSATSVTNASGVATINLTSSTTAGTATVTARGVSGDAGQTSSITFIGDVATARVTFIYRSPANVPVNSNATLNVNVRDINGNPVGGATIYWTVTQGATLASPTTLSDSNGNGTIIMAAGSVSQSVTVNANNGNGDAGRSMSFPLVGNAATARVNSVTSPSQSSAIAGSTTPIIFRASVVDGNNNLLGAGISVTWTTTGGTLNTSTSSTNDIGVSTVTLIPPTTAGTVTLRARGIASDPGITLNFPILANPDTARAAMISSSAASIDAGGATATISAIIRDANNNVVGAGVPVTWTTTAGTLSGTTSNTNASGIATVVLTSGAVDATATVRARGIASDTGQTVNVQFTTAYNANLTVSNVNNYNVRTAALAAGWNGTTKLNATVTVNGTIGSSSTSTPAFTTGTGFPTGSTITLINNGYIVGAGGAGGIAGRANYTPYTPTTPGGAGGPAIQASVAMTITNNGTIGGGGGGGGAGKDTWGGDDIPHGGGGGGGGAGSPAGIGGAGGRHDPVYGIYPTAGASGALTIGGNGGNGGPPDWDGSVGGLGGKGGNLGQAGGNGGDGVGYNNPCCTAPKSDGGAAGAAVLGSGNVTWQVIGNRLGALQ